MIDDQNSESTINNTNPQPRFEALANEHSLSERNEQRETNWSDFDMQEVLDVADRPQSQLDVLRKDIFGHKITLLPT